MEEESTEPKPENSEDQDDSWEDLTGEYEKVERFNTPGESTEEHSEDMRKKKENCCILVDYPKECSKEEEKDSYSTSRKSIKQYSEKQEKENCNTPVDSAKEYSKAQEKECCSSPVECFEEEEKVSFSSSENSIKEYSEEEGKEKFTLQKLPSFEVLPEFPKLDILKFRENVFSQQQTTFAFKNMTTSGYSWIGLKRKGHRNENWFKDYHDDFKRNTAIQVKKKSRKKKHKKTKSKNLIASTSGLVLALFATNVITFVLGCSLGWWSRDAIPTLAIYEFHMDPALL